MPRLCTAVDLGNLVNLALIVQPVFVKDSLVSLKLRLADRLL